MIRNPLDFDRLSPALKWLLGANIAVYLLQWMIGPVMIALFGLIPLRVTGSLWLWQLVTYMFLHGGAFHLFFNMLMLWMFGAIIEAQWGAREFLKYYFVCGIGAGIAATLMNWGSPIPTIGASGGIFGLLVAFAMVFPEAVVYIWFIIPMTARTMAIVFGALELMMTLGSSHSGVSAIAHLGGMVTGYLYLRFGWQTGVRSNVWWRALTGLFSRRPLRRSKRKRSETADDAMEAEVNRILDKVLLHGSESLTPEEREVMRRYAKRMKP